MLNTSFSAAPVILTEIQNCALSRTKKVFGMFVYWWMCTGKLDKKKNILDKEVTFSKRQILPSQPCTVPNLVCTTYLWDPLGSPVVKYLGTLVFLLLHPHWTPVVLTGTDCQTDCHSSFLEKGWTPLQHFHFQAHRKAGLKWIQETGSSPAKVLSHQAFVTINLKQTPLETKCPYNVLL